MPSSSTAAPTTHCLLSPIDSDAYEENPGGMSVLLARASLGTPSFAAEASGCGVDTDAFAAGSALHAASARVRADTASTAVYGFVVMSGPTSPVIRGRGRRTPPGAHYTSRPGASAVSAADAPDHTTPLASASCGNRGPLGQAIIGLGCC